MGSGGSKSVSDVVEKTSVAVDKSQDLIDEISGLFEKLESRSQEDLKQMGTSIMVFKHSFFNFTYASKDNLAGFSDWLGDVINGFKPQIENAASLANGEISSETLQGLLNTHIGEGLEMLFNLFTQILPEVGARSASNYTWSSDLRLLDGNFFLYNGAFIYDISSKSFFKSESLRCVGFFTIIVQSNSMVEQLLELRQKLFALNSFDHNVDRYNFLRAKLEQFQNDALDASDSELDRITKRIELVEKSLANLSQFLHGT
eukprot:TRINITY_DN11648_c0_g1_i1.p1 TRINITY_DN11648_c0_g1~~TRINITY_DN11648_c0_g1_i1.p1  ORF type:complete len:259 (-),score=38.94 TRINITY_DN11648_c0_g1_i1:29-805(-)